MQADRPLPRSIGRYEISSLLGQGAMGRVFLARDPVLDRQVAVKLPRNDPTLEPDQRRSLLDRMRHEARASGRVSHPNIVALFDMGEDPALGLYLVFEYVEGQTLKERIAERPLGPVSAARLAREMGDALSTAHAAGVVHRDIKPENVILAAAGSKIADFGIARVPDSTLTREGGLLGTPAYSAPECIVSGTFSPQSDQFSMAATLYEALSGSRAFPGEDTVQVASRITSEEVTPIARACGLNPRVDEVLGRALAKSAAERFPSAREFGSALAEALELAARSQLPTIPDGHHLALASTNHRRLVAGSLAVGALLGVAALELTYRARSEDAAVSAAPLAAPAPSVITGWLAPAPPPRPRPARTASSARERPKPPKSGGGGGPPVSAAAAAGNAAQLELPEPVASQ